jgi:hypothetical protein
MQGTWDGDLPFDAWAWGASYWWSSMAADGARYERGGSGTILARRGGRCDGLRDDGG